MDTRIQSKMCSKCKTVKDRDKFNKSLSRLDRMAVYCKQCEREYKKERDKSKKEFENYGII